MSLLDMIPGVSTAKLVMWGVAGGAVLAIGVAGAYYWHDYQVTKANLVTAHEEVVEKKVEVKDLTDTVEHQDASSKVTEATQTATVQAITALNKSTAKLDTTHAATIQRIDQKYDVLPKTDENVKAKADEISSDRLLRLWQVYCASNQDDSCAAVASVAASATR